MAVTPCLCEHLLAVAQHLGADQLGLNTAEPTTLVVFELQPQGSGTLLTIDESGFDAIPAERRVELHRRILA